MVVCDQEPKIRCTGAWRINRPLTYNHARMRFTYILLAHAWTVILPRTRRRRDASEDDRVGSPRFPTEKDQQPGHQQMHLKIVREVPGVPHASEVAVGVLQAELPSGKVVAELVVKVPIVNWEEVRDVWYTDISGCTGRQHAWAAHASTRWDDCAAVSKVSIKANTRLLCRSRRRGK